MYRLGRSIFILALSTAAVCGVFALLVKETHDTTAPRVDTALQEFVEDWRWEMDAANIDYHAAFNRIESIELAAAENKYAGVTDLSTRKIKINVNQLGTGKIRTRATVYHELGHFVFGLPHGSCGIMQERCPSEEELEENWKDYVNEYLQLCINNSFEAKY
jgi:hypothetical protein